MPVHARGMGWHLVLDKSTGVDGEAELGFLHVSSSPNHQAGTAVNYCMGVTFEKC
jgi:hypothetical protein